MIDKTNGTTTVPGMQGQISSELTRAAFLSSPIAEKAVVCVKNEPWCSWSLSPTVTGETTWYAHLYFHGERLNRVDLAIGATNESQSWDDWTKENEMARKMVHDALLSENLGTPPYDYTWGKVFSVFDERRGGSCIIVDYEKK